MAREEVIIVFRPWGRARVPRALTNTVLVLHHSHCPSSAVVRWSSGLQQACVPMCIVSTGSSLAVIAPCRA